MVGESLVIKQGQPESHEINNKMIVNSLTANLLTVFFIKQRRKKMKRLLCVCCLGISLCACQSDEDIVYDWYYNKVQHCTENDPGCRQYVLNKIAYLKQANQLSACAYLIKQGQICHYALSGTSWY